MTQWVPMPAPAVQELAGFPAALLPDLPVPVVFDVGGQRFASHERDGRPGVWVPPSIWLRVLGAAGHEGATVAELAALYGGTVGRAWWPQAQSECQVA